MYVGPLDRVMGSQGSAKCFGHCSHTITTRGATGPAVLGILITIGARRHSEVKIQRAVRDKLDLETLPHFEPHLIGKRRDLRPKRFPRVGYFDRFGLFLHRTPPF